MSWLTYHDSTYGFSIDYPPEYVRLRERTPPQQDPQPVYEVRFLDRQLAQSPTAEFQPPNALIEVFKLPVTQTLAVWLREHEARASRTSIRIGNLEGYRVTLPILLAPNEAYYFARDNHIFRLTFLGEHEQRMIESFRFVNTE
ncbi:MAG: hypothetical protein KJ065_11395 [Anaerolineae bacterium]|nr:hypothetical protein [Anaerolineae bacterium]